MLHNAGLLLGGKSAGGVMQIAMLAILARALGVHDFGILSVVTAQILLVSGLLAFDSNQAIVRYGALHLTDPDRGRIQALFRVGTFLDVTAALAATVVAAAVAPLIGARLGWSADAILLTQLCAPLGLANIGATAKGMLRLFNRFDLLSIQTTVTPAARLVVVALLAIFDVPLVAYVAAWVATAWIGAGFALLFAWREAGRLGLLEGFDRSPARWMRFDPGFLRFSILSHLNSAIELVPRHLSVLIVAAVIGAPAAGVFKIARDAAGAMMKPLQLFNSALYPELARLVAASSWAQLRQAAARSGAGAAALGLLVTLLMLPAGPWLIPLVFGPGYLSAAPLLVAVGFATSIRAFALAADPMLYALGHPHLPLGASVTSSLLFVAVMLWRLPLDGLIGAGWAFLAMALLGATLSGFLAWRSMEHQRRFDRVAGFA